MTFEAIYNSALDVMNKLQACGESFGPGKTVCVINTRSGRIFYGVSRVENINGMPADVHAEIVACREMQAMGESSIDTLLLIDSANRSPMLPCNGCAGYLMSISPDNAGTVVAMPDRMFRLSELAGGGAPAGMPPVQGMAAPKSAAAKGDLLKDRVSSIMSGIDDDDEDDEEFIEDHDKPKKKKLFGLF